MRRNSTLAKGQKLRGRNQKTGKDRSKEVVAFIDLQTGKIMDMQAVKPSEATKRLIKEIEANNRRRESVSKHYIDAHFREMKRALQPYYAAEKKLYRALEKAWAADARMAQRAIRNRRDGLVDNSKPTKAKS